MSMIFAENYDLLSFSQCKCMFLLHGCQRFLFNFNCIILPSTNSTGCSINSPDVVVLVPKNDRANTVVCSRNIASLVMCWQPICCWHRSLASSLSRTRLMRCETSRRDETPNSIASCLNDHAELSKLNECNSINCLSYLFSSASGTILTNSAYSISCRHTM